MLQPKLENKEPNFETEKSEEFNKNINFNDYTFQYLYNKNNTFSNFLCILKFMIKSIMKI